MYCNHSYHVERTHIWTYTKFDAYSCMYANFEEVNFADCFSHVVS